MLFKDKKSEISNKHRLEDTTDFIFIKDTISSDFNFKENEKKKPNSFDILQFSEKEISNVLDALPDLVFKVQSNGNIVYCNNQHKNLSLTRNEVIGKNISEIFHPLTHLQFVEAIEKAQSNDLMQIFEFQQFENSELREYETRLQKANSGNEFITIIRDISEQKRNELTLKKNEKKLKTLFEYAAHSMIVVNTHGKIELVNSACEMMFGYKRDELIDQTIEILIPEKYNQESEDSLTNFFSKLESQRVGNKLEMYGQCKDGSKFPIEVRVSSKENYEDTFVIVSIIDITQHKDF